MRQVYFLIVIAMVVVSANVNAGEVVGGQLSVQPLESRSDLTEMQTPEPAPYTALYQYPSYPAEQALRYQATLDAFIRAVRAEGWDVQLTKSSGTVHVTYLKRAGEKIEDIVVKELKGCKSFDSACRRYVGNLNRRIENDETLDAQAVEVVLPAQDVRYRISVNAGANYRESKNPEGRVSAIMSQKLRTLTSLIAERTVIRLSSICFGECKQLYDLKIE